MAMTNANGEERKGIEVLGRCRHCKGDGRFCDAWHQWRCCGRCRGTGREVTRDRETKTVRDLMLAGF